MEVIEAIHSRRSCRSFKDKEIDEKYISYVVHAYNLKYIDGMEDGRFAPKENLTRAQAAVVMNNLK